MSAVRILVLYDSQTGNVEKMVQLVAEGVREIQGVEVRLNPEDVLWADGIAVGSPTDMGVMSYGFLVFGAVSAKAPTDEQCQLKLAQSVSASVGRSSVACDH